MRAWLRDRPWIWVVVFFGVMVLASVVTLVIAERNRPQLVSDAHGRGWDSPVSIDRASSLCEIREFLRS